MSGNISRDALIEDVRELSGILESVHPDPYIRGGGKIAYHRRLQNLIKDISQDGMTREDFFYQIQPFVAALVDGHTNLSLIRTQKDRENPGGVPPSLASAISLLTRMATYWFELILCAFISFRYGYRESLKGYIE